MYGRALALAAVAVALCTTVSTTYAQVVVQPTPEPLVTAERTEWYLAGEPITFDGNIYYPAGAPVHFNRFEMVRSGAFRGVPLYVRTTFEPYSIMFVPLAGGLMQPYERRRAGDVAGTVGTTTPSLPVNVPTRTDTPGGITPQAPAPPVVLGDIVVPEPRQEAPRATQAPAPVGTSGRVTAPAAPRRPYEPLIRPRGLDAAYVEFRGKRWFPKEGAIDITSLGLTRIGDHHGFPVYAAPDDAEAIYIPVTRDAASPATRFSNRR